MPEFTTRDGREVRFMTRKEMLEHVAQLEEENIPMEERRDCVHCGKWGWRQLMVRVEYYDGAYPTRGWVHAWCNAAWEDSKR